MEVGDGKGCPGEDLVEVDGDDFPGQVTLVAH